MYIVRWCRKAEIRAHFTAEMGLQCDVIIRWDTNRCSLEQPRKSNGRVVMQEVMRVSP